MAEAAKKPGKQKALSIKSSKDGFRRAGRAWSKEETVVPLSELDKAQIKQLKEEPALTVTEVEIDAPDAAE